MSERPLVYLIFGIPDSERRTVLFDLIEGGIPPSEDVLYFRPKSENNSPFDEQIEALENVSVVDWEVSDSKVSHGPITAAPEKIIFLAPGDSDPADVAEALKAWISHNDCELGRIITVLNCSFLKEQEKSRAWFDACIHFSDVVLLSRRESVENKWLKEFEARYRKACYPCHIELVSKGKAKNPAAVLEPEARRMSLYFDELIPIEEDEFDDEEQPEDLKPDRYIERNESGQRVRPIIEIGKMLP
ncbi:hypothetical protein DDZ13_04400 [Coraliomargarita sinensis]|uniref:Uncharacterized protein n=1 Tax=Coraliomargarita sinensis TaxID=2174842 RepID=A0A317ZMN0_9BACT|nr:GTP-binding protein [Coraliomargarita sinensis]PXA05208.1 hypothetical protein DDZ13_04400 [Coraliomargarita sinensis]